MIATSPVLLSQVKESINFNNSSINKLLYNIHSIDVPGDDHHYHGPTTVIIDQLI